MKTELKTPKPRVDFSALIPPGLQVQVFTEQGEAALAGYLAECEAESGDADNASGENAASKSSGD